MGLFQFRTEVVGRLLNWCGFLAPYPALSTVRSACSSADNIFVTGANPNTLGRLSKGLVWTAIAYPAGFTNTSGCVAYDRVRKRLFCSGTVGAQCRVAYSDDDGANWTLAAAGVLPASLASSIAANNGIVVVSSGSNLYVSVDNGVTFGLNVAITGAAFVSSRIVYYPSWGAFSISTATGNNAFTSRDGVNWSVSTLGAFSGGGANTPPAFIEFLDGEYVAAPLSGYAVPDSVLLTNRNLSAAGTVSVRVPRIAALNAQNSPYSIIKSGIIYFLFNGYPYTYTKSRGVVRCGIGSFTGVGSAFQSVNNILVDFDDTLYIIADQGMGQLLNKPYLDELAM